MFRVNSNDARVPDTALRVRRGAACDGGMGDACAAPEADSWTSDTMAVEHRRSNGKYCAASADSSRRSSWLRLLLQLARMGMFHAVPILWRVHRMHHADLDFDVTTGIRFHPVEIVISMGLKLAAVALFGTPAAGVLAFEVLLNATSMFNHSNIDIPKGRDAILRMFAVTPDMHRVHHSIVVRETNSNFGFNLPWWDRLLGTYRAQPEAGHDAMTIGIEQFREARELRLERMLTQPWRGGTGAYPING